MPSIHPPTITITLDDEQQNLVKRINKEQSYAVLSDHHNTLFNGISVIFALHSLFSFIDDQVNLGYKNWLPVLSLLALGMLGAYFILLVSNLYFHMNKADERSGQMTLIYTNRSNRDMNQILAEARESRTRQLKSDLTDSKSLADESDNLNQTLRPWLISCATVLSLHVHGIAGACLTTGAAVILEAHEMHFHHRFK